MPEIDVAVTVVYMAWDTANSVGRTGDDGNHTLRAVSDVTAFIPGNAPVEIDNTNLQGLYRLTLTAPENDGLMMTLGGESSTADVVIIPVSWTNSSAIQIADAILSRGVDNVEATAGAGTVAELILAAFESVIAAGGDWSIYRTDHVTLFSTRTVTTDGSAAPIVEVT